MSIAYQERCSDSPYVETVTHGRTLADDAVIRPAESRWHMVFVRQDGETRVVLAGPWTTAGIAAWSAGAEIVWVRFELGTYIPRLPARDLVNTELTLPDATGRSFRLDGSVREFPGPDDVEALVGGLVRDGILVRDPAVVAALRDGPQGLSPRTLRHRFLRATGQAEGQVRQVERARRAAELLRRGGSIPDAVHEAGYFDQSHLTRALKRWIGYTPARIARSAGPG